MNEGFKYLHIKSKTSFKKGLAILDKMLICFL